MIASRKNPIYPGAALPGQEAISISNSEFFLIFAKVLVALFVSAFVLAAAYVAVATWHSSQFNPGSPASQEVVTLEGSSFNVLAGSADPAETGELHFTGLSSGERGLVAQRVSFMARNHPYVELDIAGRNPGALVYLIWRTADKPAELFHRRVLSQGHESTMVSMAPEENWRGEITEVGIDIYGDLREEPLVISRLAFLPYQRTALLSAVWSEWTSFRGWSLRSINHLDQNEIGTVSPTAAAAAWAAITMVLLMLTKTVSPHQRVVALAIAFLVPWIFLDLLWQQELETQLDETLYLFSGKTNEQKHLADFDVEIYTYAKRIQSLIGDNDTSRIFLLKDSYGHDFERLKLQFYLLPLNIYNYGKYPPEEAVKAGDYILTLGPLPKLRFDQSEQRLNWKKGRTLHVESVDEHAMGRLYRVLEPAHSPSNRSKPGVGAFD